MSVLNASKLNYFFWFNKSPNLNFIKEEVNKSKKLFNKYKWPIIDVTRRSVEETAASILKIFEINKNKWK